MADITVEYVRHMGDDLAVANAARCSFDRQSDQFSTKDERLIHFLARGCPADEWDDYIMSLVQESNSWEVIEELVAELRRMPTHWAPFAHPQITLRETVPIFVARQRFKHKIGFVESEVSRRYVDSEPEFYTPAVWRKRGENKKQGSSDEAVVALDWFIDSRQKPAWTGPDTHAAYKDHVAASIHYYNTLIRNNICPEEARMVLPQSMMTTYQVTGSLYAFSQLYNTRTYAGAQAEIKELATKIGEIIEPLYPVSWSALTQ